VSTPNSSAAGGDPETWEGAAEDLTPLASSLCAPNYNQTFFFPLDYRLSSNHSHQITPTSQNLYFLRKIQSLSQLSA